MIWLSPTGAGLPRGLGALVHLGSERDDGTSAEVHRIGPDGTVDAVTEAVHVEQLDRDGAVQLARSLAALQPGQFLDLGGSAEAVAGTGARALPGRLTMGELIGPNGLEDPDATSERWRAGERRSTLAAPLGRVGGGAFNVDLRADGPHALVAGTTGSG